MFSGLSLLGLGSVGLLVFYGLGVSVSGFF